MKRFLPPLLLLALGSSAVASLLPGWQLDVVSVGSRTAGLSWTPRPTDCLPGDDYILQLQVPEVPGGPPVKWTTVGSRSYFVGGSGAVTPRNGAIVDELEPEANYAVRVLVGGIPSMTRTFTTTRDFGGVLTATVVNNDDLQINWTADPDAEGYVLQYIDQQIGISEALSLSSLANSYFTSDLADNTPYLVRIYAELPGGARTGWAETIVYTGQGTPAPVSAAPLSGGPTIRLNWAQVDASTEFEIERSAWDNTSYTPLAKPPGFETSYEDTSTANSIKYFYRVRAVVFPGTPTAWVETCSWSSPPPAPAGLAATTVTDSTIALEWNALQGIGQYVVERCDPPGTSWEAVGTTNTNSFLDGLATDHPVIPSTSYKYRVRGQTLQTFVGDTAPSLVLNVTSAPPSPGPAIAFLNGGGTAIVIQWQNIASATGYRLERRVAPVSGNFGPWSLFANLPAGVASDLDSSFTSGQTHQYRVRSENASGASAWVESAPLTVGSSYPTGVTTTPGSGPGNNDCDDAITIAWIAVPGADGYKILRGFGTPVEFVVSGGSTTSYVDTGLAPNTVYSYQVVATSSGPDSLPSAISNELTCQSLGATAGGTSVNLSWAELDSPFSEYRLERRNVDLGTSFVELATIAGRTNTSYVDTDTDPDTSYEYRVRGWYAADGGTFGRYSVVDGATTGPPPVTGLEVLYCDDNEITVGWDPAPSAETITVLRKPADSGSFATVATLPGNATEFNDTGLPSETGYIYWIFAGNDNGENASIQFGPVSTKFTLNLTETGPWNAALAWSSPATPGVTEILVQQDTGAGWNTVAVLPSTATSSTRSNICYQWRYRILARNIAGDVVATSTTETFQATLAFRAPDASTASDTGILVTWTAVPGATGFRLQRGPGSSGPWTEVAVLGGGDTSHLDSGLTPDTRYYYRLAVIDPCGGDLPYSGADIARTWGTREAWRRGWWGNDLAVALGLGVYGDFADFDGDGCLNIYEFLHKTDPTDPADCFVPEIRLVEDPKGTYVEVSWRIRENPDGITFGVDLSGDLKGFIDSKDVPEAELFGGVDGPFGVRFPLFTTIQDTKTQAYARLRLDRF